MKELELKVTGMMCTGCENRIKNVLSVVNGVKSVEANHEKGKVKILAEDNVNIDKIKEAIEDLDFKVEE